MGAEHPDGIDSREAAPETTRSAGCREEHLIEAQKAVVRGKRLKSHVAGKEQTAVRGRRCFFASEDQRRTNPRSDLTCEGEEREVRGVGRDSTAVFGIDQREGPVVVNP